ncbi:MAG: hypothetical protein AAF799_37050 [Myxococcota bacterium]
MLGGADNPLYSAFKALIDVLCYPMTLLDGRGRTGGIVALTLGVLMLPAGWWVASTTSLLGLGLCGVGIAYWFYGLSRLMGNEARLYRDFDTDVPLPKPLPKPELEAVLESRPLPFFVCARCRVVMDPGECGGVCPRCSSETDCIPVYKDDDRGIARSSIY